MHRSAEAVAKLTGDTINNHEYEGAWWSADTIIFELSQRGYAVDYHYEEDFDFDDPSVVGYIIQIPEKFHFVTVRKSYIKTNMVEVVDSLQGIETMRHRRLALQAKKQKWNIISVKNRTEI